MVELFLYIHLEEAVNWSTRNKYSCFKFDPPPQLFKLYIRSAIGSSTTVAFGQYTALVYSRVCVRFERAVHAYTRIIVNMCAVRFVLSFAWRLLLLLRDTVIKYAVKGARCNSSSGAISPRKYQECICTLETRLYFPARYEIIIVMETRSKYIMESSTRTVWNVCNVRFLHNGIRLSLASILLDP